MRSFRHARKLICLFAIIGFLGGFAADAGAGEATGKIRWKTASLAPKDMGYAVYVREILFPALYEATDNNLVFKAYWGGVMGNDSQAIKNMHIGRLHASGLSGQGTFTMCPEAAVLGLPFLFKSYEETDYLKARMIGTFDEVLKPRGFKILAWLDQGFDETYSLDRPMKSLDDFQGERFATWFGPLEGRLLKKLGAVPTPLEAMEIPPSVRSGVVDAVIAPSIWVVGTQLYTQFKYMNPLKFRYSPGFWLLTRKAWDELPAEYQENIDNVRLAMAQEFNDKVRKDLEQFQEAMFEYGIQRVTSSEADIRGLKRQATPLWFELADDLYPRELLEEVMDHLADYRASESRVVAAAPAPVVLPAAPVESVPKPAAPEAAPVPEVRAVEAAPPAATEVKEEESVVLARYEDTPEDVEAASGLSWNEDAKEVARIQLKLQALGYYGLGVDGILGPVTYKGIRNFRREAGLPGGGVDKELAKALDSRIRKAQTALKTAGYYAGEVDGIPGPATYRAARAFQKDSGLPPTGILNPSTLAFLGMD